ncbi:DUF4198 domain-containing protein [Salibaculum griseiflavum]|uniref:DUF4198 domain-containing protein n=1 Tax=Salibaculum griseiflavum TaxID=1914409 RepID=A0A2V1NZH2_9RHOB|nr:DUF4198 domain-containing protein [Salibaculum griseiflavum]PWG15723.1 DUF4198 domain-containing protein [Salibaculum griseiflavum]
MRIIFLALALLAAPVTAHELWLEPEAYQIPSDGKLQAEIVNGEDFAGNRLSYLPRRFSRFEVVLGERVEPVENRLGARPALDGGPLGNGLHVIVYEANTARVSYSGLDTFQSFAEHKDFPNAIADHRARGLPETDFGEAYSRHVKALIAVGDGAGQDRRLGLETEIVALENPYTAASDTLPVQLHYGEAPRADAQIELFEKAPDGSVTVTYHRTDAEGIATLPIKPGHAYLVDAVVLREPAEQLAQDRDVVWETLWAALTFAVR